MSGVNRWNPRAGRTGRRDPEPSNPPTPTRIGTVRRASPHSLERRLDRFDRTRSAAGFRRVRANRPKPDLGLNDGPGDPLRCGNIPTSKVAVADIDHLSLLHEKAQGLLGFLPWRRPALVLPPARPGHEAGPLRPDRVCRRLSPLAGQHDRLMANLFPQVEALGFGKTAEQLTTKGLSPFNLCSA
jgi:hypothetical protein